MNLLLASAAAASEVSGLLMIGLNDATKPFGRVSLDPFDHIKVERYDSRSEASSQWTGALDMPAWLPSDASEIVRTATTVDQVELIALTSSVEIGFSDCTALDTPSTPSLTTIDVPETSAQVYDCGGWHVFDENGRWYGWQGPETLPR